MLSRLRSKHRVKFAGLDLCPPQMLAPRGKVAGFFRFARVPDRKHRDIVPFREIDNHGIVGAFEGVIFFELGPQAPCLATHDCVSLRIVISPAAENRDANRGLLEVFAV